MTHVDHDGLAGQLLEIDAVPHALDAELRSVVHEAVAMHAGTDAGLVDEIDRDLLDDAGANATEHILGRMPLEYDVVDVVLMQQLAKEQAGGAGADDCDLSAIIHGSCLRAARTVALGRSGRKLRVRPRLRPRG